MAKKALPKIKTTKMGDLEEKVDSAPKKRRGRPKKIQTAAEVEAAINLKEFQKSEAKLKKEKEKTISARKLFKTLEVDIQEANNSLAEIGSILSADFAARIDQEKAEIAMLQQDSSKQKIKEEEKGLEKKNLGSKIKDQAKKGMAPIKSMTDKLIELATFLLIGITGNAVFEFMKSDTFKAAWRGFTKFIIKGTAWLLKTTAAFIGFFSIKNLFKLLKSGVKGLISAPKKIFGFAKNLFKLPKRLKGVFKGLSGKLKNIGAKGAEVFATIGNIIKKVKNFLKGGVGKVLGFGKNLLKKGKNFIKSGVKGLKTAGKGVGKTVGKSLGKGAGKSVLKKIPFVGLGLGAAFAVDRLRKGDWGGALMELGSGAASMIPGVGTAVSTAIDVGLIAKDIGDAKKEQEQGEVTAAEVGKRVTKGQRVLVGESGPEMLEMPFTGTVKHATETLNTLKDEAGQDGGVEIVNQSNPPIMSKPPEVADVADQAANPSEFVSSYNKLNDYMNTTPDVLGMTV
jgi:hypothetical protein